MSGGEKRVAVHVERSRLRFTGRAPECVDRGANDDPREPGLLEHLLPARTGQPAGNSTGPKIDVAHRLDGNGATVGNVCELQNPAWTKYAVNFGEDGLLVGAEVDHSV